MTILEAVREWLSCCPLLSGERICVDFLPDDAASYSVDTTPCNPVVKRYMDGSTARRFEFTVSTRNYYGNLDRQQMDNLALFEQLQSWMEAQNRARRLPELGTGRKATKLEVTTSGYLFTNKEDTARYQMQCRLIYYQKGER